MNTQVQFDVQKTGHPIVIETSAALGVNQAQAYGFKLVAASPAEVIVQATQSFEEAVDTVRAAAQTIVDKLRSIGDEVDEAKVVFGVKFGVQGKALIAAASAEANFTVELSWKRTPVAANG